MARPDLSIDTEINPECTTMTMWDTTDDYGAGTVTTAGIESSTIVVRNKSTGVYFTYTFTIGTNTISAATASLNGGTAVNILSQLSSTVFPFIVNVNELDLWKTYTNFTQPDFDDAVFQIEYSIIRTTATAYNYTTSVAKLKTCDTCCCITKKFASLDPVCGCSDSAMCNAVHADTWLKVAQSAANMGDVTKAVAALTKASELCDCEECG